MASLHKALTDERTAPSAAALVAAPGPRHGAIRIARPTNARLDPWPARPARRWMLRIIFAAPYVAIALLTHRSAEQLASPNSQLIDRISSIDWGRADIAWLGDIFPPISTLVVAIVPGGRLGVAILGGLVAGVFLQQMAQIMVQRRFPRLTVVILMLALAANPLFAYTATENLPAFLGLAFFGLGVAHIVRFVAWGNTQSGFRAGILLMLATLTDLGGLLYVLTAASAAPFLSLGRRGQPGARAANVLVIVYPTVAALGALVALNLIFLRSPLGSLGERIFAGSGERLQSLGALFTQPGGWLLFASVFSAWMVALIVRRPGSILVSSLVFVAILGTFVIGLIPTGSVGNTFILMTLMAIALIPVARTVWSVRLTTVVALGQIAIAWASAFNRDATIAWIGAFWGT